MIAGRWRPRERLRALLHLTEPPWRTALALALGVFIGCTPLWFFQTALAVLLAAAFRLNKTATVTGAWLNLPWFAPFVYGAALEVGTWLVPGQDAAATEAVARLLAGPDAFDWREALAMLRATSLALFAGTTVVGLAAAAITYVVAVRTLATRRRQGAAAPSDRRHAA